jgi:type IV secretory pathway TrbF-like protein
MTKPKTRQIRIPIEAFVEDIRHGMTDRSLMKKYGITQEKTLLKAFDKLVDSGRVSIRELQNRSPFINTQAIVDFLGNTGSIDEID